MKLTYVSLIHAVQSTSAASLTALKMESSSSVNKRPSVGSVKGKVKSCFNDSYDYVCNDGVQLLLSRNHFSSVSL